MCEALERRFYWLKNEMDEQKEKMRNEMDEQKKKIRTLEKVCFRFSTYFSYNGTIRMKDI